MRVWNGLESVVEPLPATSVAIGTFDGLHRGHQALIRAAVDDARLHGRPAVVFTFDRHPAELISPDRAPGYLTTPAQRERLVEALGVDHLVVARFDQHLRQMTPEAFVGDVLAGRLHARAVLVGEGFRFGRSHAGDTALLRQAQERYGYALTVLPPVMVGGRKASSTRVRRLVEAGDVVSAREVLGHPYVLEGQVVEGRRLGRELGYPTANLALSTRQVVPADGIYASWATHAGGRSPGACSIGYRPTVGGRHRTIEVYLLDFTGDLYGSRLELEPVKRLRDEVRFESLDALKAQMARDVALVRTLLDGH